MNEVNRNQRKIEVLSPAGSFEAFRAAIQGGCDAVYFGVEQLNMRARSSNNFTLDDLNEIARIAQEHGIKTYITLNTVMYDHDLQLMRSIVNQAKESGITAVIASDQAVMNHCRKVGMPLHVSTQANISNIESVEFYANFADVVVMARELSLSQVAQITREIERREVTGPSGNPIGVEIFAHGALCMAVSGKCYLSLHSHYASANRGACIQNCRRSYIVTDKEEGYELEIDNEYIMSAQDLCTIDFLDKILEAGVQVLKIEGRGRSADYVYTTTQCYREAVDAINEGTYTPEKISVWKERLATVYNRGFWDGYYLGRKMGEWSASYGSLATQKKILVGKGVKYYPQANVAEFLVESHPIQKGSKIMITGPTTGYLETILDEIRVNGEIVEEAKQGETFTLQINERIRPSDKIYKIVEA